MQSRGESRAGEKKRIVGMAPGIFSMAGKRKMSAQELGGGGGERQTRSVPLLFGGFRMKSPFLGWLFRESWWLLPVAHMALFWTGTAVSLLMPHGRTCHLAEFCLIWLGKGVVLLFPALLSVQLLREKWKLALRTVLCFAILLTPTAVWQCFLAGLPCPPGMAKLPLHPVCYALFWLGGASAACLALAGMVQLLRRRWKPMWVTILFSAMTLPPFLWLVWKLSGAYP